ncbi:MAG: aldehyde ferredoxin oxidoreductase family protein [Promethearchaeota archaeon]
MGKILRVNLDSGEIKTEDTRKEDEAEFIGGAGVAAAIFTREVPADIDPWDGKNLLIFSVGPFSGTPVPFCGRHFVMAKSPLTNILGESSAGGFFGAELKFAGYDHVILQGKSDIPVYLSLTENNSKLHDAQHLWGKGVRETEERIKKELGDNKFKIASIGIGGENLVRYASIINETGHAAGRTGMGAIMGSKKLKAIAIRGSKKPIVQDPELLSKAIKTIRQMVQNTPHAQVMKELGTLVHMDNYVSAGDVPIKNYTESRWKGTKKIGAYAVKERGQIKHHGCFNCPVACRGKIEYQGEWVDWPEYEFLAMLGANLYIDDLETLIKWNVIINDHGIDCITLGATLGCFLEAAERGLLDVDLKSLGFQPDPEKEGSFIIWGNVEPIERLIQMIAFREGIGNDLAEGVKRFCELKNLPEDLHTHVKGLEVPAHEPRANNMTALDYATSSRGAYHCFEPLHLSFMMNLKKDIALSEKIDPFSKNETPIIAVKKIQDTSEAFTACGGCIFGFHYTDQITPWIECLNAITGTTYTVDSWMKCGEKIFNLKRKFNVACGITKEDDTLGKRFFTPIEKGGTKKNIPPLKEMLTRYYEFRGWNAKGKPP